jgi:segregation and condensation protein B
MTNIENRTGLENRALVEGVIFAATHPVSAKTLADVLSLDLELVESLLQEIMAECAHGTHGFELKKVGGGFQFRTKVELKEIMARFYEKKPPRLSGPLLEVLSVIAYKQPVIRPEIEKIRGVDCTGVLKTLLDKELIEMKGRSPLPGNPVLYATTPKFLEWFQIAGLEELPPLSEVEALNKDAAEGAEHLMGLLNRDEGFHAESIQEMDETLQSVGRIKSIEEIEASLLEPSQQST